MDKSHRSTVCIRSLPPPRTSAKAKGTSQGAHTSASLVVRSKYKEMCGRILKSLNVENLYRGMSKLKLKINVNLPHLLCIVVSVALNGESERFGTWVNAKPTKSLKFAI